MRERVTVETTAGVTWTESVWSGGELVSERDSDGTLLTYVWGPDRTPLAVKVASSVHPSGTYYYHTDAAGSVVAITDESGDVVASYRYDAFGAACEPEGSDGWLAGRNPLRYRSYYLDRETGLYYLPARYYEPETARFLSPDPAPPAAGDPLSLNAYAYCQGDPVNLVDPDGARHEAGGGANRVSREASELAKKGHVKEAKKVQTRFRAQVTLNYRKGYRYDDAGYPTDAWYYAQGIWEELEWEAAQAAADAGWDNVQDLLAGVSVVSGGVAAYASVAAIAGAPTILGGLAPAVVAVVASGVSTTATVTSAFITEWRSRQYQSLSADTRIAAHTLSLLAVATSSVSVLSLEASMAGAALEWRD